MKYISTRGQHKNGLTASEVIIKGIAADGGLYVPEQVPVLSTEELNALIGMDYKQTAKFVLGKFLTDFLPEQIEQCVEDAYTAQSFANGEARIVQLEEHTSVLELWHGPTCAFKDMALQLLPRLLVTSLRKQGITDTAVVLTATSGDTGKAALDGFSDVDGIRIAVFYPDQGVSAIQKRQMTTQRGSNVAVAGVRGNFDDAQNTVKMIFADAGFNQELRQKGMFLTSANSINWGRLVPQIVYYIYTCAQLKQRGLLNNGDAVDVCVPTGNFGNILACYYAKKMGAPIGKLICASNSNNVLTDFIQTGTYDRTRDFVKTVSPSMDILISSNLERLLFELSGRDGAYISELMQQLKDTGSYTVHSGVKQQLDELFAASFCDDTATLAEIKRVWQEQQYLLDTHSAVASEVLYRFRRAHPSERQAIIVSTASPFKFASDVVRAVSDKEPENELMAMETLAETTGIDVPKALRDTISLPIVHEDIINKEEAKAWLLRQLD